MIRWRFRGSDRVDRGRLRERGPRFYFDEDPGVAVAADEIDLSPLLSVLTVDNPESALLKHTGGLTFPPTSQRDGRGLMHIS